jgi:hypothetical protein
MLENQREQSRSHRLEVTIIAKALPQVGDKHGETVCVAAMDDERRWYRLYPVTFRLLSTDQRFTRWSRVSAKCRVVAPNKDRRSESRNVDQASIELIGELRPSGRTAFIEKALVTSTKRERAQGRSLALLRPEEPTFHWRPRSPEAITERLSAYQRLAAQPDIFGTKPLKPLTPAPFEFFYRYRDEDGPHECRCHDWEVEQTYINWERKYGERRTLDLMQERYGVEYPSGGMAFSMGTHSAYPDIWMIIGVVRMKPTTQPSLL